MRCFNIWHEFSQEKTSGVLSQLKVNLHVQLLSLVEDFNKLGLKITI